MAPLVAALALAGAALVALPAAAQDSQYWHERYHGILSMAAYGDYETLCPQQTFTAAALQKSFPGSTEAPWTLLSRWGPTASGLEGFNVIIPEMDKVVMVFKGIYGWETLNMTPTSLAPLHLGNCENCTAHAGALQAYLEAKEATNDWEVVKQSVNSTGHQWSVTGHGFGGMVATIASLDLGWRGLCHWSHSHGSPRVLNPAAANLYNRLFAGEAGQRCVANQDSVPNTIPESADYTHTLTGFHIFGTNTTFGMNWDTCVTNANDPECLGGNVPADHLFYYTRQGSCGAQNRVNESAQAALLASESSQFALTATTTFNPSTLLPSSSSAAPNSTSLLVSSSTVVPESTVTAAPATVTAAQSASAPAAIASNSGAGSLFVKPFSALAFVAGLVAVIA